MCNHKYIPTYKKWIPTKDGNYIKKYRVLICEKCGKDKISKSPESKYKILDEGLKKIYDKVSEKQEAEYVRNTHKLLDKFNNKIGDLKL